MCFAMVSRVSFARDLAPSCSIMTAQILNGPRKLIHTALALTKPCCPYPPHALQQTLYLGDVVKHLELGLGKVEVQRCVGLLLDFALQLGIKLAVPVPIAEEVLGPGRLLVASPLFQFRIALRCQGRLTFMPGFEPPLQL